MPAPFRGADYFYALSAAAAEPLYDLLPAIRFDTMISPAYDMLLPPVATL